MRTKERGNYRNDKTCTQLVENRDKRGEEGACVRFTQKFKFNCGFFLCILFCSVSKTLIHMHTQAHKSFPKISKLV